MLLEHSGVVAGEEVLGLCWILNRLECLKAYSFAGASNKKNKQKSFINIMMSRQAEHYQFSGNSQKKIIFKKKQKKTKGRRKKSV